MGIFIIYTIVIICTLFLYILTHGYKKKVFNELDKNQHRLKFCYGMSAFMIDFINTYIHRFHYENIRAKLSRLHINKADEKEAYLYMVSKLSLSILAFMIIETAGYIKCMENTFSKSEKVLYIERPDYGEGVKNYSLIMDCGDGTNEEIDVTLTERKHTEREIMQMFADCQEELMNEFLGKNDTLENVTEDVNLIAGLGDGITVDWSISDMDIIDYSGNIRWENVTQNKWVEIEAVLSFENYSQSYTFSLFLNREERENILMIQDELSNMIKNSSQYDKQIKLPEFIAGYDVQFFIKKEKNTLLYMIIGLAAAVIIYMAREKETDKKLEERKRQLESDYAPIVSKLTILQGSGMALLSAWDKIIADYEKDDCKIRFAYEEMKYARNRMKAGYSETASYLEFGRRCGIHSYIKFANLLEQNIKKGTKGLADILNTEAREALEERKALARKKGDEAGTKLLIPMGIMLIISIIMIIVPALMTINI